MTDGPVLVTVVPANTANGVAVPSPMAAWARGLTPDAPNAAASPIVSAATGTVERATSRSRRPKAALFPDFIKFLPYPRTVRLTPDRQRAACVDDT